MKERRDHAAIEYILQYRITAAVMYCMYILVVRVVCTKNAFSHTSTVTTLSRLLSRVHRNYVKTCFMLSPISKMPM